ncbi:MAG: hypothetical protein K0Q72_3354, partial [Armatimonadetes bacterium]|nr:hypothetical protein [Armatimonadota bacterium]
LAGGAGARGTFAQQPDSARQLIGTWKGQIVDGGGAQGPIEVTEFVVTPDKITATRSGSRFPMGGGSYRLGNQQGMRTLDATGTEGGARGKSFMGIYTLEGDTLRWCVANPGRPRPTDIASRAAQGQYLLILNRVR